MGLLMWRRDEAVMTRHVTSVHAQVDHARAFRATVASPSLLSL